MNVWRACDGLAPLALIRRSVIKISPILHNLQTRSHEGGDQTLPAAPEGTDEPHE